MNFENQKNNQEKKPNYFEYDRIQEGVFARITILGEQVIANIFSSKNPSIDIQQINDIVNQVNTNPENKTVEMKIKSIVNTIDNIIGHKENPNLEQKSLEQEQSISKIDRKKIFEAKNTQNQNFDSHELIKKPILPDWVDPYKFEEYKKKQKKKIIETKNITDNSLENNKEIPNITNNEQQHLTITDLSNKKEQTQKQPIEIEELQNIFYLPLSTKVKKHKLHPESKDFLAKLLNSSFSKILSLFYPSQKNSAQINYQEISEKVIKLQLKQDPKLKPRVNKTFANKLN